MKPFDPEVFSTVPETRRPFVALGVVGILQGVATIATAFALTGVVVAIARSADVRMPLTWLVVLFAARGLLAAAAEYVAARAGAVVSTALRARLLAAWAGRPDGIRPAAATQLTLATSGCASVEPYVARYLPALVAAAIVPVGAVLTLAIVDWPSALVVVLTLPLLPLFAALIGRATQDETARRWRALADLGGHFLDVVRGLPTLVNYGRGERQLGTIRAVSQEHRVATMRTLRIAFLSSAALELLATISVAIVAVLCGVRLADGAMPLSMAMVAILLAPEAYWPIRRVGQEFHSAADGAQALAEIQAELSARDGAAAAAGAGEAGAGVAADDRRGALPALAAVEMREVTYTYPGAPEPVLAGIDLDAGPGLTAITGPSGVGKTTLIELIAGLRAPDSGTVTAPPCHVVTQRPYLPTGTLGRALALGNGAAPQAIWSALRDVGLDGFVAGLPDGLETVVGDDGFGLSAGQRARIGLARALLAPESVILLDEPTAHLDDASVAIAHTAIAQLATRRAVLAITHRPELVALADREIRVASERVPLSAERARPGSADASASPRGDLDAGPRGSSGAARGADTSHGAATKPLLAEVASVSNPSDTAAVQRVVHGEGGSQRTTAAAAGAGRSRRQAPPERVPLPALGLPDLRTLRLTRPLLAAGVIGGLALASGVALTATSGWLIVKADERPVIQTLLAAIVAVRTFGISRPVFRYWERLGTHDAAFADLAERRVQTYAALVPLTPARLGRRGRSDLLTGVVDDLDDIVGAQIRVTVPGLSALIAWAITVAVTAGFDLRIGAWVAALGLVVLAIALLAERLEAVGAAQLLRARADVNRVAATLTGQATEIAAIGAGPAVLAELEAASRAWVDTTMRQARGRALAAAGILLAVGATTLAVAVTLAGDTRHTAPVAAMLVLAPVAAADALTPLAEAARALARARGSATRLRGVLDQEPAVAQALDPQAGGTTGNPQDAASRARLDTKARASNRANTSPGVGGDNGGGADTEASERHTPIALRDISARWTLERPLALAPIDLDVPAGTHLAIAGPNGAGKSTLLAVLARHLDPESGTYFLDETDACRMPLPAARGRLAVVDDSPYVFASTLRENLRFAATEPTDGALIEALERAGLGAWLRGLPDGLETRLGIGGRGMSGGEQARLGLARALVSQRPVVLLDEPVAHLDSATARAVIDDLLSASDTRTVIMVSHREDGRDGFDRVLALQPPLP